MGKANFKLVPVTGIVGVESEQVCYRPVLVPKSEITFQELAEIISDKCSLTSADIVAATHALMTEALRWIENCHRVDLGPLGTMVQSVRSRVPIYDVEEVKNSDIEFDSVVYRPDFNVKRHLSFNTYQRVRSAEHLKVYTYEERLDNILALVQNNMQISVNRVREVNRVSVAKARRDLLDLVEQGKLRMRYYINHWVYELV